MSPEPQSPLPQCSKVAELVERIREIALPCGYAIAVHGSQQRDLDLIAVPWTDGALSNRALVRALCQPHGPFVEGLKSGKPHGRIAYVLHGVPGSAGVNYIDLSVMPRAAK